MESTTLVYQGLTSIEMKAQKWGALGLDYHQQPVDTSGYAWLVLNVNPAGTNNLNFSITIFDQQTSVNYVFLADYLEGNPLQPNEWRRILIPFSDLNPDEITFTSIMIQNISVNPATCYLDEIFFAKVP